MSSVAIASNVNSQKKYSSIVIGSSSAFRYFSPSFISISNDKTIPRLPSICAFSDDLLDDVFCLQLYDDYLNDSNLEDNEKMSFDEVMQVLGLNLS